MKPNDERSVSFGPWLTRQLKLREWTGADFARRMGDTTSNGTVSLWLNGKRIPNPVSCERIADVLMLDVDEVLVKAGHRPPVFEVDPNSPEGQFLPIIRRIAWDERSIESFKQQLEFQAKQWPAKREN